MKINLSCAVVRDLLPSYIDDLTTDETNEAIRGHLAECTSCKEVLDAMTDTPNTPSLTEEDKSEMNFLKKQRTKLLALVTAIPVMAVLFLIASVIYGKMQEPKFNFQEFAVGAKRGDTFIFGTFEQDGDLSNGPEDIIWIVLKNDKVGELTAISKYGLAEHPFHEEDIPVTWDHSPLRQWMNGEFYENAFTSEEKRLILEKENRNRPNPYYETPSGENTRDYVYLLTVEEASGMTADLNTCFPTASGISSGIISNVATGHCEWWLRTAGIRDDTACRVTYSSYADGIGTKVNVPGIAVRPCITIKYR